MKKFLLGFFVLGASFVSAQEVSRDTVLKKVVARMTERLDIEESRLDGIDEKLSEMNSIVDVLNRLRISGYMQAQYEVHDTDPKKDVTNTFYIRRARVKFTYRATDGVSFVLCPDVVFEKISLKDAYVQLNDRWMNTFSLWVGQFNRPSYEVEYSSASREFAERTLVTRTLYPNEREIGAKLEANFKEKYEIPLKLQLAVFNGNAGLGAVSDQAKDIDSNKDVMARAAYSLRMPDKGLGIDFGAHGYFGSTAIIKNPVANSFTDVNNNLFTPKLGDDLKKQWFGGEVQAYYDFLGGLSLKAEYIAGTLSSTLEAAQFNKLRNGNKVRDFQGYYIALVKNVGSKNTASVRFDVYDPNRKLSGNDVKAKDDLEYDAWTFNWQYFFSENIKIVACYTKSINETSTAVSGFDKKLKDNLFTLRFQAQF